MAEPFLGEIKMFAGNFAPRGWAFCDGQLLAVSQNDALFSLLGTIYGGDGRTTFGLPDLRGRVPVHAGSGPGLSTYRLGGKAGVETVTLSADNLPAHTHAVKVTSSGANSANPADVVLATSSQATMYFAGEATVGMNAGAISNTGGSQEHTNIQPCLSIYFIMALVGIYPSRT